MHGHTFAHLRRYPVQKGLFNNAIISPAARILNTIRTNSTTSSTSVTVEKKGDIAFLSINNSTKRNALSSDVLRDLKTELLQIKNTTRFNDSQNSNNIKVLVLRTAGPVFSSGHDLKELLRGDKESLSGIFGLCSEVMLLIRSLPQPVIAQVQGLATAAGCQLVATCDLAVAADTASFATPGVKIGLFCTTPGVALSRAVGTKKAMEMLLTGNAITAQEALASGLISKVVSPETLERETLEVAQTIAKSSLETLAMGKKAFYEQLEVRDISSAYLHASQVMVDNMQTHDAQEGISAFVEKREPKWKF